MPLKGICWLTSNNDWPAIIPWLCIQLYVCGNAAMAALARSGFGVEQALASRYRALPALFWLAWIMIASQSTTKKSSFQFNIK
jgi:hypothetical protein